MTATFSTWLGPRPGAWVARRMAHETAIHRWDAAGGAFDAALAIDGIDELLDELAPLDHLAERLDGTPSTVPLHSTDSDDGEGLVTFGPDRITSERVNGKGDPTARSPATHPH